MNIGKLNHGEVTNNMKEASDSMKTVCDTDPTLSD